MRIKIIRNNDKYKMESDSQSIKVAIRIRPFNSQETLEK
jgi:hypothetical protein